MKTWIAALLAGFFLIWAAPAAAYNDDAGEYLEGNAYTLHGQQLQMGIWSAGYGIVDGLQVSTYVLAWALPLLNAEVKWRFCCGENWGLAVSSGVVYTDTALLWALSLEEGDDASVVVVPFELFVTWQFTPKWNVSLSPIYTQVFVDGQIDSASFNGASAVSNLQFLLQLEWRYNRVMSFLLSFRSLAAQTTDASAQTSIKADDYTTVNVLGTGSTGKVEVDDRGSLMARMAFSWETFNLVVGAGYGNLNLPVVNFMAENKSPLIDLDFYWRW